MRKISTSDLPDVGYRLKRRTQKRHLTPSTQELPPCSTLPAQAPPHSTEAERSLLGAILLDPERLIDVAPRLEPADFFDPAHRRIYEAIIKLYEKGRGIDIVTLADKLRDDRHVEAAGGSAYLAELPQSVPIAAHALEYAKILRDALLRRKLASACGDVSKLLCDPSVSAETLLERAEQKLLALSRVSPDSRPKHIAEIGSEAYDRYAALHEAKDKTSLFGITTGFSAVDELVTGLPPGHLMILAARPSMGKTALALDIARNVAGRLRKNVAIFSLEMTRQEIMDRIVASMLGVETWKLKKGELTEADFRRLGAFFDDLKNHPIYIDDDADTTLTNLRAKARREELQSGLDLLIIDYLQLIEVTGREASENRTQQVTLISRSLKNLARELHCPIIALSQLSRSCEQRNPPIPVLSDLRESGAIEQDADSVVMLYRESLYNEDCADPALTDVYLRKNRNGPAGHIELHFDGARMSFTEG